MREMFRFSDLVRWSLMSALALVYGINLAWAQVRAQTVASGLEHPWGLAFLPGDKYLVTERPGRLRVVQADGRLGAPIAGLPIVAAQGQGGLLDLVLDSDFARNRQLYFCFSEPAAQGKNSTALARATLSQNETELHNLQVIFSQKPKVASNLHFGCRIVESRDASGRADGMLFLSLGERYHHKEDAQKLDNHHGKVVRIFKDGRVPPDNPFVTQSGALPEIWSFGHRNPQGMAMSPSGVLWLHEHGPQGGDEINLPEKGANFGWPVVTHGENYGGGKIGEGLTSAPGMTGPLHYWAPSIAPSGMAFVTSQRYGPEWVGNLMVGALKFAYLNRIELTPGGRVKKETKLLLDLRQRIRDVRQGPDGYLYVLTDEDKGSLIRVLPL